MEDGSLEPACRVADEANGGPVAEAGAPSRQGSPEHTDYVAPPCDQRTTIQHVADRARVVFGEDGAEVAERLLSRADEIHEDLGGQFEWLLLAVASVEVHERYSIRVPALVVPTLVSDAVNLRDDKIIVTGPMREILQKPPRPLPAPVKAASAWRRRASYRATG